MNLPSLNHIMVSVVSAAILGAVAHFSFNMLNWADLAGQQVFTNGVAAGSFISLVIASIFGLLQRGSSAAATDNGQRKTIFVGNLAFKANSEQLRELFAKYGNVHTVRIMTDRMTRRPRGFAFVEMDGKTAPKAIKAINGLEFMGRELRVNEGNDRKPREDSRDQQQDEFNDFDDGE
jgi:hypothetical protein